MRAAVPSRQNSWGAGTRTRGNAFAETVRTHGLGQLVTHHGGIHDRAKAKALYLDADVFLLPTTYPTEAQPLSVIEALNAGTPVIATSHASLPEMLREDVEGHFVPAKDPEAIADAVERLLEFDHWKRLSVGARARFETAFSPETVKDRWVALLDAAVCP
jgi:glycosyltransferase involved in cell wall biosynthesis